MRKVFHAALSALAILAAGCSLGGGTGSVTFRADGSDKYTGGGGARAAESAPAEQARPEGMTLRIWLDGDDKDFREVADKSGGTASFDGIAVGTKVKARAFAYKGDANTRLYEGESEEITVAEGDNPVKLVMKKAGSAGSGSGGGTSSGGPETGVGDDGTSTGVIDDGSAVGSRIGEKSKPTEVGDIVFSDGSATPYGEGLVLTEEQESKAVAVIFYAGTSSDALGARTLGVGLAQSATKIAWCGAGAGAANRDVETIQCTPNDDSGSYTFAGDTDGSDNLEQIAEFLATAGESGANINDTGVSCAGGSSTASTDEAAANYPAFYFAKTYAGQAGSRVAGTSYATGWYLPSIAELYQLYATMTTVNGAIDKCGGTRISKSTSSGIYWSSSQMDSPEKARVLYTYLSNNWCDYAARKSGEQQFVCAIRAF